MRRYYIMSHIYLIVIVLAVVMSVSHIMCEGTENSTKNERIERRHIKFAKDNSTNSCYNIGSKKVCKLKLGPKQEDLDPNYYKGYTGFTLYKQNGRDVGPNIGLMHFVKGERSDELRGYCTPRKTRHAGAYRYVYDKCPSDEDDESLVASGYCYRASDKQLGFNSYTFNDKSLPFLDGKYYENEDRGMNKDEKEMLTKCLEEWERHNFRAINWECDFAKLPQNLPEHFSLARVRRSMGCPVCVGQSCSVGLRQPASGVGRANVASGATTLLALTGCALRQMVYVEL